MIRECFCSVRKLGIFTALASVLALAGAVSADVFNMPAGQTSLSFVTVGNPGNAADPRVEDDGMTGFGGVAYTYRMGMFDVTAAQYTQFLNAVAKTDTFGLYNSSMANSPNAGATAVGCGIIRLGAPGSYTYGVTRGEENDPVNYVSWIDAARFCNWLQNGQPTGAQSAGTTETGAYTITGNTTTKRNAGALYALPTESEWYKAAYYDPNFGGPGVGGYWLYPTKSNNVPSNILSSSGTNNANYYLNGYTDPINFFTTVGTFAASPSAYGTYDQGGDIWQWNEGALSTNSDIRGGAFYDAGPAFPSKYLSAGARYDGYSPSNEAYNVGIRVVAVPEPATLTLAAAGVTGLLLQRGRRGSRR
jgi:formylglycine-generating enzyme required for sulfatase activity